MPGLNLTRAEAEERAAIVTPHRYQVSLDLSADTPTFASSTTISFSATPGSTSFVDLVAASVSRIELNGKELPLSAYDDNRITIGPLLSENSLTVDADCLYMHTGEGLHAFTDPADGKRYCYSQFEVPDARRVFATFEQPDLKASFEFSVTTPPDWTVFSNSPTPTPTAQGENLRFDFEATPAISTYITAIVAGPYYGVTSEYTDNNGKVTPMGVYCRQSLADHLDADFVLDITKKGFAFFEDAYQIPYPFAKYDQIFVPEYNAGAMENAGCVTYRDQYIYRSKPTAWQLEVLANTILHELAHMWFGDLVTMRWWDDLWLNESFAEFMSHLAAAEATQFSDAWIGFLQRKEWGLNNDQMPTTHPIRADISDLADVEVNFDGITYAKGAAVLRQLVSYVGRDNFLQGINRYLTAHAYGNATLQDLLGELEATSGRDLTQWANVWLEESGVTTLRPDFDLDDEGRFTRLAIVQEATSPGASLRPHRMVISGYDLVDGSLQRTLRSELDVEGAHTNVPEFVGRTHPEILLLNDEDLAYAKIRLDEMSLNTAIASISALADPLARRVVIAAAWDMTRDAEMAASRFVDLALNALSTETSVATVSSLLAQLRRASTAYAAPAHRPALLAHVGDELISLATAAAPGSDQQRLFVKSAASIANTPSHYQWLSDLFRGTDILEGLDVDTDLRWDLLCALVRGGLCDDSDIAHMRERDRTMTGEQRAQQALASRDSASVRQAAWNQIMHDEALSNDTRWSIASGFWSHADTQPDVYLPFVHDFFEQIIDSWNTLTFHIASGVVETMFPADVAGYLPDADPVALSNQWLESHQSQPSSLRRLMREGKATAERMIRAQECDARN